MRLAANNGCRLHLVGELGFGLEEKKLRRAGLDYRDTDNISRYPGFSEFTEEMDRSPDTGLHDQCQMFLHQN